MQLDCGLQALRGYMGTYTTNYNLFMPSVGETGWGDLVNGNFSTIDTTMKSLSNRITAVENEVNGALKCTSVTTTGTITSSGKVTANGGLASTTGTFSGNVTAPFFNGGWGAGKIYVINTSSLGITNLPPYEYYSQNSNGTIDFIRVNLLNNSYGTINWTGYLNHVTLSTNYNGYISEVVALGTCAFAISVPVGVTLKCGSYTRVGDGALVDIPIATVNYILTHPVTITGSLSTSVSSSNAVIRIGVNAKSISGYSNTAYFI